jgi:SAM-dependent methyltransferase
MHPDSAVSADDDTPSKGLDIGVQMRAGHVDIAEGDVVVLDMVRRALAGRPEGAGSATIVDIGSGSGVLSERLAAELPGHRIVANDNARGSSRRAADRLAPYPRASVFDRSFLEWEQPADIFISWGSHHHFPHSYLRQIAALLKPGGRLIIGDEFCPEYLQADELASGRAWLVDGYLFTSDDEESAYRTAGVLPPSVERREEARRQALWRWYRFVIDQAVARGDWTVALLELQIARDDLTTGFEDEHKTSPLLLETELADAGFRILDKHNIGDREPRLRSFVIYEAEPVAKGRG